MCGIVGYIGENQAVPVLLNGLSKLEYRGYDSAGISVYHDGIHTIKVKGKLAGLREKVEKDDKKSSHIGIGHTRWATHGVPNEINSHPHNSQNGKISVVHNGIIENYLELKNMLIEKGYTFKSETDTEVVAQLFEDLYDGDMVSTTRKLLEKIRGAYALGIMCTDHPDTLVAVRKDCPLLIGLGKGENYIASDIPALLEYTRDYYLLETNEIAVLKNDGVKLYDIDGKEIKKGVYHVTWDIAAAEKGGYDYFMMKEIMEQPEALKKTIQPRVTESGIHLEDVSLTEEEIKNCGRIHIVACGSAMHAGVVGRYVIEETCRIPVEVDIASEFRYRNPILAKNDLCIIISQSGETADTLAALRLFKENHIPVIGIVNVVGSSIAREADYCLYTYAGPEIAVASTKAYSVQVAMMYLLGFRIAADKGAPMDWCRRQLPKLLNAVSYLPHVLAMEPEFFRYAEGLKNAEHLFYLGRGLDYSLAMEGSLKLKEISYIHCEAYAAGELKHGTISLITDGTPVIALATQRKTLGKMISNVKEVKARGAHVLLITLEGLEVDPECYDEIIRLPAVEDEYVPLLLVVTLQLIALGAANARGCDVDKPRNLAKSVTVE